MLMQVNLCITVVNSKLTVGGKDPKMWKSLSMLDKNQAFSDNKRLQTVK